jgi:hypothetical protein
MLLLNVKKDLKLITEEEALALQSTKKRWENHKKL